MSMLQYKSAQRAVESVSRAVGKQIHKLPDSVFHIIESLEKQGIEIRGLS